jgi:mannose-6-phosphate isomerase-like protein (cupin superfamily)
MALGESHGQQAADAIFCPASAIPTRTAWGRRELSAITRLLCMPAQRANIYRPKEWFKVLQTTKRSQTAVMTLGSGQSSGDTAEAHEGSEQVLLLVEGELTAEIGGKRSRMKAGDVVVIPPRVKHKFTNRSVRPAVTFSVYAPPEYPPDEAG